MSRVATLRVTRLAVGATLLMLVVGGCDKSRTLLPSAPSVSTQPAPPQFAAGPYSISGVVADNGHPITNANVNAWVELGSAGYSYTYAHGPLHTDASGGYRLTNLPGGARVWVKFYQEGYVQPCAASAIISGDLTMDLALVSIANLTASPMPSAPGLRGVSGTVVEMTVTGSQPVAGAFVTAEIGVDPTIAPSENSAAYTVSDAAGRFALCGLPANTTVYIEADAVGGASGEISVAPGKTSDVQIVVPSSTIVPWSIR